MTVVNILFHVFGAADDPARREKTGNSARRFIEEYLSVRNVTGQFKQMFSTLAGENS